MPKTIDLTLETSTTTIIDYLLSLGLLHQTPKQSSTEKPGEGNMNLVLRFRYDQASLILKQSKTFVNKHPSIPAPQERIVTEAKFYEYAIKVKEIAPQMPEMLHYDAQNHLMIMEDLGASSDFLYLYEPQQQLEVKEMEALLTYLSHLHQKTWTIQEKENFPNNLKLRQLNHQHIFILPFSENNGFPLDQIQEGLENLAKSYISDEKLKKEIQELGETYLSEGHHLLHGDYYPGSWVRTKEGFKIIDPEFGFMGAVEFELGTFIAHLLLSGHVLEPIFQSIQTHYQIEFDKKRAIQYAGVEMMRRLIGIAQLPLQLGLEEKIRLLAKARKMIIT